MTFWPAFLLCASLTLYLYRFTIGGINLSLFRIVLPAWTAMVCVDVLRGRVRWSRRYVPLLAILAVLVAINLIDFAGLAGHPDLRRDIFNHVANLWLLLLVAIAIDREARLERLLSAFAWSSLVPAFIAIYATATRRLPFESLLRGRGASTVRTLEYVDGWDQTYQRASGSFHDPNFYGVYLLLVLAVLLFLRTRASASGDVRGRRAWDALFAVNVLCLGLTLSRTAFIGFAVVLVAAAWIDVRARRFCLVAGAGALLIVVLATVLQTTAFHARVAKRDAGGVSASAVEALEGRVALNTVRDRYRYMSNGWRVFTAHPLAGAGSASLKKPGLLGATAHMAYLTWLARYGLAGALIYLAFLLYPLVRLHTARIDPSYRLLLIPTFAALLVVYLAHDVFMFLEVQYLFFGLAYAVTLHPFAEQPKQS